MPQSWHCQEQWKDLLIFGPFDFFLGRRELFGSQFQISSCTYMFVHGGGKKKALYCKTCQMRPPKWLKGGNGEGGRNALKTIFFLMV